jgi:NitT/TauT family transport system substrate-binding protein
MRSGSDYLQSIKNGSRAAFLGTVSGALAIAAVAPGAALAEDVVRFGTIPIDPASEVFYAQDMGFFDKAGFKADIAPFSSGGAVAAAIAGGSIDIGNIDLVSIAAAHARGIPFVVLAPAGVYTRAAESYVLLVKPNAPIRTAKDLAGKTIAVNGLKNINQIPTEAWIDNNGGDSKSVKFIELPFPAMIPALEDDRLDAIAVTEPTLAITNGKYRVISLADHNVAPSFMVAGWTTTLGWVQKNPTLAKKVTATLLETARWANANHDKTAAILSKYSKLPLETAQRMHRSYYGEKLDAALMQPVIDAAAKYGVIDKTFPASAIMES